MTSQDKAWDLAAAINMMLDGGRRRLAALTLSPELLLELLKPGKVLYEVTAGALPEDAELVKFGVDASERSIRLLIASREFARVPIGQSPPELDLPQIEWARGEVVTVDCRPGRN